jgi:hypothetical protein
MITKYKTHTIASGYFDKNRSRQNIAWFQEYFEQLLKEDLQKYTSLTEIHQKLSNAVGNREFSSRQAALRYLEAYHEAVRNSREL